MHAKLKGVSFDTWLKIGSGLVWAIIIGGGIFLGMQRSIASLSVSQKTQDREIVRTQGKHKEDVMILREEHDVDIEEVKEDIEEVEEEVEEQEDVNTQQMIMLERHALVIDNLLKRAERLNGKNE